MITIFTPSFADESDTNAQNLTVKEIVARLDPGKFHVTLLCEGTADPRILERPNTRILRWRKHGNTLRTLLYLLRQKPDVYFYPREGPLDAGFFRLRHWLRFPTAVVTHVVSGGLDRGPIRPMLKRNIREADLLFGNSIFLSNLLHDRFGESAGIMHNGIDSRFFFPPDRSGRPDGLAVFFAGSFRPYKRAEIVIRQAARWPEVQFRLAGKGEEERSCRMLAEELRCENVVFLGHLSLQELGNEMRHADLFLFPSILEGHPQVLGQAAACGVPVVAMDNYHPDYVIHEKTGFLARTDQELQSFFELLLTHPELRQSMSHCAIEHARKFDWNEITRRWQDAFEQVVKQKRAI
jgi:glycosyltransferase involved in cell wall biosynthesis